MFVTLVVFSNTSFSSALSKGDPPTRPQLTPNFSAKLDWLPPSVATCLLQVCLSYTLQGSLSLAHRYEISPAINCAKLNPPWTLLRKLSNLAHLLHFSIPVGGPFESFTLTNLCAKCHPHAVDHSFRSQFQAALVMMWATFFLLPVDVTHKFLTCGSSGISKCLPFSSSISGCFSPGTSTLLSSSRLATVSSPCTWPTTFPSSNSGGVLLQFAGRSDQLPPRTWRRLSFSTFRGTLSPPLQVHASLVYSAWPLIFWQSVPSSEGPFPYSTPSLCETLSSCLPSQTWTEVLEVCCHNVPPVSRLPLRRDILVRKRFSCSIPMCELLLWLLDPSWIP